MAIEARFDLPPEEALRFFRKKGLRTGFSWRDVWADEHNTAFTVAKMADVDLLQDVKGAVDIAIAEGQTLAQFKKAITPRLVKAGWWGQREQVDPETGRKELVQLGSARRLETIFRTNMMSAYAAGEWAQIEEAAEDTPFLMYDAVDDNRTREQHRAWNGITLRWDDPWWNTHRPPNGWNCRCSVIQLSDRDMRGMGKDAPDKAPPIKRREWVNKRTGEVMQIPLGIDPGWDYNPGAAKRPQSASVQLMQKLAGVEAPAGAKAAASIAESWVPQLRTAYGRWLDDVLATGKTRHQWHPIGVMADQDVTFLAAQGIEAGNAVVSVEDRLIIGRKAQRHETAGDALKPSQWRWLPDAMNNPTAVLWDRDDKTLLYVIADPEGDRGQRLVVVPKYWTKPKLELNAVRSAFRVGLNVLKDERRYELVRGRRE